jgi:hypothetical protein
LVKIGGGEGQAEDAILIERMRGDLHGAGAAAVVTHGGEQALDFERFGRGVRGGHLLAIAEVIKHGAEQAAAFLRRVEKMMQEEGRGGLPIRAGDTGDGE